jgi:hypothetical protein
VGRCGKRLIKEYVHVAPDGTETVGKQLLDVMHMIGERGGTWKKRSVRR